MKVSLVAAVTLDGRIAEASDQISLDWTSKEDKRFFVKKTKEAGCIVMGRATYDTIGRPLPGRLNVVMTRDPSKFESIPGSLEYTDASSQDILQDLESRGFKEAIIGGGAQVWSTFIEAGLITDFFITVEPVLFGKGVPLVEGIEPQRLQLVSHEKLGEQAILTHYRRYDA